jgi:hypothetical protein
MIERAYTASELSAILRGIKDRTGLTATFILSWVDLKPTFIVEGEQIVGATIEEAHAKALAEVEHIVRPSDAYAIIGVAAE